MNYLIPIQVSEAAKVEIHESDGIFLRALSAPKIEEIQVAFEPKGRLFLEPLGNFN